MKIWCESFNGFKKLMEKNNWNNHTLPNDVAIISICEPNVSDEYHIFNSTENIINLDFYDITDYDLTYAYGNDISEEEAEYAKSIKGLTDEQAYELFNFIERNLGKDIYVHCSAGISRSQGVVKFILDCYPDMYTETNPNNPCDYPNIHVTSLLKNCFRKKYKNIW